MHHFARAELKRMIRKLAYYEALKHKRSPFEKARLIFTAHFTGKRKHDPDNLYVKPMLDGIVDAGILKDDNNTIVQSVTLQVVTGAESDFVTIEIL